MIRSFAARRQLFVGRAADHLMIAGRSADRRRWLGAPLAHEDSARVSPTRPPLKTADLSMPPVWRCPVAEPQRAAGGRTHHQQRSPERPSSSVRAKAE